MDINQYLIKYPPEIHSWGGKVTFSLGYPVHGWIQMTVTCNVYQQWVVVQISDAYDPFPQFFRWLECIVAGKLPAEFHIDDENQGVTLRAAPCEGDEFLFTIEEWLWAHRDGDKRPIHMYVHASRRQVVGEFLKRWDDFIKNQYDPAHWERGFDLPALDTSSLRRFVRRKVEKA